jgi:hypothetical protein
MQCKGRAFFCNFQTFGRFFLKKKRFFFQDAENQGRFFEKKSLAVPLARLFLLLQ